MLEGTKKAGNLWMKSNAATLTKIGLQRCKIEPNLLKLVDTSGVTFHIALYVDNLFICYPKGTRAILDKLFIKPYTAVYKCTILGKPTKHVGIEISHDRVALTMDLKQTRYIKTIHAKFCSARTTKDFTIPIPASGIDAFHAMQQAETDAEKDTLGSRSVLELFGLLLWATATHPEICLYMSFLCRFMHKPKLEHYETGLAVLSYLYHVTDIGLHYGSRSAMLEVYKDATWNSHSRDYCGHAILFCGAAISFCSQLM
jgi:hypothetical protein